MKRQSSDCSLQDFFVFITAQNLELNIKKVKDKKKEALKSV